MKPLSIDAARLEASLEALGRIGAYRDESAGLTGVCRLALTAADGEGRRHVVQLMRELDLAVTVDAIGNVYGRRAGREDHLRPVIAGSHIDSVATAGIFDGCLGVLGALEVLRTLSDAGVVTRRPLVVACFTEEEGARFATDMLGSAVAAGRIELERAWALTDRQGLSVKGELAAIGFLGSAPARLAPPHAYVECHIEQGPVLAAAGAEIGVVTGVQAICWHELTVRGTSAHAGTTPMELRADAGLAVARVQLKLREMVGSGRHGADLRATVGAVRLTPGLVNVVAGGALATVDIRHPDDSVLERALAELTAFYEQVAREERVTLEFRQTARTPTVRFDPKVRQLVARCAAARGLKHKELVSGAGHDCQEIASVCPAGMVFVPGEHQGISHNPREFSTPEQCAHGVNVLLDVLMTLAQEDGP